LKRKEALKIAAVSLLSIFIFFGSIFLLIISVPSSYGALLGALVGFILICILYGCFVPVWFEDYIKEFWKKEEEKKNDKEEKNKESC